MNELNAVLRKSEDRKVLVGEFQKSLGDTIILLLELKNRPGVTQGDRIEIDNIVEKLEIIRINLSGIFSKSWCEKVFGIIIRADSLRRKLFSD